ncbi:MAG TPA: pilus assembly protein TadG-related protein [Anaerolineaceae bacterium]|nr:pilus assembly protein TadG-related protein [Anaerolineaceae bacterium]
MKPIKKEKGQIVVILALAMVAIIGITALAIDGSLIYNERRQDQNSADSAALAGAGAAAEYLKDIQSGTLICGQTAGTQVTQRIVTAVRASVLVDGITAAEMPKLSDDAALANVDQGFTVACNWYNTLGIQYLDIHVKVATDMPTNFARVLSPNNLKTIVESTARVYPRQPLAFGNGLVSLSDKCKNKEGGIYFLGGGQLYKKGTYLTNGGVFSNSCIEAQSGIVQVTGGSIQYYTNCVNCFNNPDVQPSPVQANTKLPKDMIKAPVCPAKTSDNTHNSSTYSSTAAEPIPPGWYTNGLNSTNNAALFLAPGLYCIEGGMTNNSKSTITGNGVTLYFKSGDVQLNQNNAGDVKLTSCKTEPCGNPSAVQGLLMYFDASNPNYFPDVSLNGSSTNIFKGPGFHVE